MLKPTLCNQKLSNGLVVPSTTVNKKLKEYLPLEFDNEEDRKKAHKALQVLIFLCGGGTIFGDAREARILAIKALGQQLLGKDVGFEEYC